MQTVNKQWALYQPIMQRFLLTADNDQCCKETLKLASSRYLLFLCRVDSALIQDNLILNNSNCSLYKPNDDSYIDISQNSATWAKEITITQVEKSTKIIDFHSVDKEINWLQLVYHWVDFLNYIETRVEVIPFNLIPYFVEPDMVQHRLTGLTYQQFDEIKQFKKQIKLYLYYGQDTLVTQQQIQTLLDNLCTIKELYQTWQNQ